MRKPNTSVFTLVLMAALTPGAFAQGISEMGGAYAGSSVLSGAARRGSVGSGVNNAFGSLQMQMNAGVGLPKGAGGAAGAGDLPFPNSAVTVKNVAKASNKAYNLAVQKEKAGKLAEAVTYYNQALAYRQNIWGYRDPAVGRILMKLGDLNTKLGKLKQASTCYEHCLAAAVKLYGQGEYALCPYLLKVSKSLYDQKDYKGAYNYMNQVYMLRLRKLGEDDKSTIAAATVLSKICVDAGSYGEASELISKSLEARERLNDTAGPEYLALLDDYVMVLKKQNHGEKAAEFEAKAKALREKLGVSETKNPDKEATDKESGEKRSDSVEPGAATGAGQEKSDKPKVDSDKPDSDKVDRDKIDKDQSDKNMNKGKSDAGQKSQTGQSVMTKSQNPNGVSQD